MSDEDLQNGNSLEDAEGTLADALSDTFSDFDGIPLPAPIKKNLFKSVCSLIGATTDIGIALAESKAADIRAKMAGNVTVTKAAALAAAKQFGQNADLTDRAVLFFGAKIVREQTNRESILKHAVGYLKERPFSTESPNEIDDDWLQRFVRHSEVVSNEQMQEVWANVLAQEITSPGSYSLRALSILSEMSKEDALAFQRACLCSFQSTGVGGLLFLANSMNIGTKDLNDRFYKIVNMDDWALLQSLSIVYPGSFSDPLKLPYGQEEALIISVAGKSFQLWLPKKPPKAVDAGHYIKFTPVGLELKKLIEPPIQHALIEIYREAWEREGILYSE